MNATTLNYQNLIVKRVRQKYPSLILGLVASFFISLAVFNTISSLKLFSSENKAVVKGAINKKPGKKYVVKEGDDLWKIAQENYGSGFNAKDISTANKITDPNSIVAGQQLILPKVSPKDPTSGEISATMTSQVTYTGSTYVVQPGDFFWAIAQKVYGDGNGWLRIAQFNGIGYPYSVEIGVTLKIPR